MYNVWHNIPIDRRKEIRSTTCKKERELILTASYFNTRHPVLLLQLKSNDLFRQNTSYTIIGMLACRLLCMLWCSEGINH